VGLAGIVFSFGEDARDDAVSIGLRKEGDSAEEGGDLDGRHCVICEWLSRVEACLTG